MLFNGRVFQSALNPVLKTGGAVMLGGRHLTLSPYALYSLIGKTTVSKTVRYRFESYYECQKERFNVINRNNDTNNNEKEEFN